MARSEDNYIPRVLYAEVRKAYCDSTWVKYVFAGTTAGLAGSAAIIAVVPPLLKQPWKRLAGVVWGGSLALGAVTGMYYRNSCLRGAWDEVMRAHIAGKEDGQFQEYPQPPVGFWTELNQILADEEASE